MTSEYKPNNEELVSFVDGELDSEMSLAIRNAINGDRELQKRIDKFRKSRTILQEAFASIETETPPHIIAKIDQMNSHLNNERDHSLLQKIFMNFRIQYAIPAAAFSLGVLVNPALFTPRSDQYENGFLTDRQNQITLRGPEVAQILPSIETGIDVKQLLNARAIQNGTEIYSGSSLKANIEFTILLLSPFDGTATILEKISETEETEMTSIEISNNRYISFPVMKVSQQSNLSLVVRLETEDVVISQTLNFNVES